MLRKTTLLSLLSLASFGIFAQVAPEAKSKFTFSGYVDSYYTANLNKPLSRDNQGASGTARAFDQKAGTFALGLVQTKIAYAAANGKTDAVLDLTFGPNADLGQYGNAIGPLTTKIGSSLAIKQAYFNWKPSSKLTFTAGQFGTHIGYEVIDAPVNYNYSLSNLFNNGPFYHIGVKANYAVSDKFSLMAGVVNNIDGLYDNNRAKGLIGQVFISPKAGWNIYVNGISSNESAVDTLGKSLDGNYSLLDIVTTYQITPKFLVGLNSAWGSEKKDGGAKKGWGGLAVYSNYAISDVFSIGGRFETFDNSEAARGLVNGVNGVKMNSLTITPTFTIPGGNLLIKPEFRMDTADQKFFQNEKGDFDKESQSTLALAFIYKF